jgi:hypothetical protein
MFNSNQSSCQQCRIIELSWYYNFSVGAGSLLLHLSKFTAITAEFLEIGEAALLIAAQHNGVIQLGPRNDVRFIFLVILPCVLP